MELDVAAVSAAVYLLERILVVQHTELVLLVEHERPTHEAVAIETVQTRLRAHAHRVGRHPQLLIARVQLAFVFNDQHIPFAHFVVCERKKYVY